MSYKPSILASADGGTGVSNSSNITLGGAINTANSFTTSGNFALTLTQTGSTNVTLPTSGTLATTAQVPALPVTVANGGTGVGTLTGVLTGNGTSNVTANAVTQYGVLIGGASNAVGSTAIGNAGQILRSGGAGVNPSYSTATYPSTAGTSGKVLVSDGTNIVSSTPTFPNASATSGKIIKSDGTNWIASTETYAAPSTSGNVMTSDGTNWTSSAPGGYVLNMNQIGTFNPADATTYFVGVLSTGWETSATTATTQLVVPKTGTVTQVYGRVYMTAGSSQSVTLSLRLNNTTDTTITSSSNWSSSPVAFNATGLAIAVSAGDFLQLKIATPTWTPTNPTAVFVTYSIYIA